MDKKHRYVGAIRNLQPSFACVLNWGSVLYKLIRTIKELDWPNTQPMWDSTQSLATLHKHTCKIMVLPQNIII